MPCNADSWAHAASAICPCFSLSMRTLSHTHAHAASKPAQCRSVSDLAARLCGKATASIECSSCWQPWIAFPFLLLLSALTFVPLQLFLLFPPFGRPACYTHTWVEGWASVLASAVKNRSGKRYFGCSLSWPDAYSTTSCCPCNMYSRDLSSSLSVLRLLVGLWLLLCASICLTIYRRPYSRKIDTRTLHQRFRD